MGKGTMFFLFMWIMTCIAGSVVAGNVAFIQTRLTADIDADDNVLHLHSTAGLPSSGIVVVEEEHIAYAAKTSTTLYGSPVSQLIRGSQGTEAKAHEAGVAVTTVPGSLMSSSADYNIAAMTDSAGVWAAIAAPLAFFRLLGSFLFLPLGFLGTDLALLSYLWMVLGIGFIVALVISLAGGRRV